MFTALYLVKLPRQKAQILVTTLILLLLVSLTVLVITSTVVKNSRQVFNNIEYEKSYNYAETRLIEAAEKLNDPNLQLFDLAATGSANPLGKTCDPLATNTKYYCGYDENNGERRTILTVEDTNIVEAYDLSPGEYFDIILFKNQADQGYRNPISVKWEGESAFDISLIYLDGQDRLKNVHEVVDPTSGSDQIYTTKGKPTSGFLQNRITPSNEGEIIVNLQQINTSKVPANAKLRYLRIMAVNRQLGASISVRPVEDSNLPNQVRRLEAFSYLVAELESSAPVVYTQLPLSPAVPQALDNALSFATIQQPICGNGVVEGGEQCDDGNNVDADNCNNKCEEGGICRYVVGGIDYCDGNGNVSGCYGQKGFSAGGVPSGSNGLRYVLSGNYLGPNLSDLDRFMSTSGDTVNNSDLLIYFSFFAGSTDSRIASKLDEYINAGSDVLIISDDPQFRGIPNESIGVSKWGVRTVQKTGNYIARGIPTQTTNYDIYQAMKGHNFLLTTAGLPGYEPLRKTSIAIAIELAAKGYTTVAQLASLTYEEVEKISVQPYTDYSKVKSVSCQYGVTFDSVGDSADDDSTAFQQTPFERGCIWLMMEYKNGARVHFIGTAGLSGWNNPACPQSTCPRNENVMPFVIKGICDSKKRPTTAPGSFVNTLKADANDVINSVTIRTNGSDTADVPIERKWDGYDIINIETGAKKPQCTRYNAYDLYKKGGTDSRSEDLWEYCRNPEFP